MCEAIEQISTVLLVDAMRDTSKQDKIRHKSSRSRLTCALQRLLRWSHTHYCFSTISILDKANVIPLSLFHYNLLSFYFQTFPNIVPVHQGHTFHDKYSVFTHSFRMTCTLVIAQALFSLRCWLQNCLSILSHLVLLLVLLAPIVDLAKFRANCQKILDLAKAKNVTVRPHVKTHKTL